HLFQCLVYGEGGRLLARREFLERFQKGRKYRLGCQGDEVMIEEPVIIGIRRDVSALEWICSQIVDFRYPARHERLSPGPHGSRNSLFHEDYLPIIVPKRHQVAVIAEINEAFARAFLFLPG